MPKNKLSKDRLSQGRPSIGRLSHVDEKGNPKMVGVGNKQITERTARARALVTVSQEIIDQITNKDIQTKKGPVFHTAIIAGVLGAKKTGELIPFCHPLGLENCQIDIGFNEQNQIVIDCLASLHGKTGVEMEALAGATVAALTIYDMCKALSHDIVINEIKLMEKTGGKRDFKRDI